MIKYLMNSDIPVLKFTIDTSDEDFYIEDMEVLCNDMLPYELKDYVVSTKDVDSKKSSKDKDVFRDFLASRMLNLSRENAKVILNVAALPQSIKTSSRLKIALACKGLTMSDCFWIKDEGEVSKFENVCLRKNKLSKASYVVAILGRHISTTVEEIRPDLSTTGMYPKYWKRENGCVTMWKTDITTGFVNTESELLCSKILLNHNVNALEYVKKEKDGKVFAVSKCMSNDDVSYIPAQSIKDWCFHTNQNFYDFIKNNFLVDFANMCVVDYVLFNTDRHFENWGFVVSNKTNEILSFAPLFDHNQALIGDYLNTNINELIYEPLNISFQKSIEQFAKYSDISWTKELLPPKCQERLKIIENLKRTNYKNIDFEHNEQHKEPSKCNE